VYVCEKERGAKIATALEEGNNFKQCLFSTGPNLAGRRIWGWENWGFRALLRQI
jgi:hypothetical protein